VVLGILLLPSAMARVALGMEGWLMLDLVLFLAASGSFFAFYLSAARARHRPWGVSVRSALMTMALGIGLTAPVSRAVWAGLGAWGNGTPFHRTPKGGLQGLRRYRSPGARTDTWMKLALTVWMALSTVLALMWGYYPTLPFLILFGAGWGWLGIGELLDGRRTRPRIGGDGADVPPAATLGTAHVPA
jgi:hypothetical protein